MRGTRACGAPAAAAAAAAAPRQQPGPSWNVYVRVCVCVCVQFCFFSGTSGELRALRWWALLSARLACWLR